MKLIVVATKGSKRSGNYGHAGIPGHQGGSASKASAFADTLIRKSGLKIGINRIAADISSGRSVIGSYWIMGNGDIIKTRKLHTQIADEVLKELGQTSSFPTQVVARASGIVAWHAERHSWAFRMPNKLSRLQKETINVLTDMPGAKKGEFTVGTRIAAIDKHTAFRLLG